MVSNTPKERAIPAVMESMIREWLTQTTEENNFDGAILSSEMFLYGNGF